MDDLVPAHRITVVLRDPVQTERLKLFARRHPDLRLRITPSPPEEEESDLMVLPVELLADSAQQPGGRRPDTPRIFYGSSHSLRRAFLAGCADFLKDPWDPDELECRIRRVLQKRESAFVCSRGKAVLRDQAFRCPSGEIALRFPEERLLRALFLHRNQVVARQALYYALWGRLPDGKSRAVDVHLSSVRKKLSALRPPACCRIEAVRRVGYRLAVR